MEYICPCCGKSALKSERAVGADQRLSMARRKPSPGDLTMCVNCAEIFQFDEAMDLSMPDLDTLMQLSPAQSYMIDLSQKRIRSGGIVNLPNPGERIAAIYEACIATSTCHFLGWGVYEGDFVPPPEINPTLNQGAPNPRLRLDNGQIVWGCECWWGSEKEFKDIIGSFRKVIPTDIEKVRKQANEKPNETTEQDTQESKVDPAAALSKRTPLKWRWSK
jgi:hypothetical protein